MPRLLPKRQSDTEFARLRADRKTQARLRHQPTQSLTPRPRTRRTPGVQAVRREHLRTNLFKRSSVLNGLIDGYVANNAGGGRNERIRICSSMDEKAAAKDGTLFRGAIYGKAGPPSSSQHHFVRVMEVSARLLLSLSPGHGFQGLNIALHLCGNLVFGNF